ncbi:hypothetical protein AB1N83_009883 [Pleurotus pulmonarius]
MCVRIQILLFVPVLLLAVAWLGWLFTTPCPWFPSFLKHRRAPLFFSQLLYICPRRDHKTQFAYERYSDTDSRSVYLRQSWNQLQRQPSADDSWL